MSWTKEQEEAFAKKMQNLAGRDEIDLEENFMVYARAVAGELLTFAVELVRARGGTMTAEDLSRSIHAARCGFTRELDAVAQHITTQGATVATLQAEVAELELAGSDARAERDAAREDVATLRVEVERLKKENAECHRGIGEMRWYLSSTRKALLDAESEGERLKAELTGAQERSRMLLDAKNHWSGRARAAESRLAAIREIVLKVRKPPRGGDATTDAYDEGYGDGWAKRGAVMRSEIDALEGVAAQQETPPQCRCSAGSERTDVMHMPGCPLARWVLEGDAPQEAKAFNADAERQPTISELEEILNAPENTYKVEVRPDGQVRAVKRYPRLPMCTHDDAATPGHPERVKERSEAMWKIVAPDAPPGSPVIDEAAVSRALAESESIRESEAYQMGAEAMRAACWEAVRRQLISDGWVEVDRAWHFIKAAIEGAVP